MMKNEGNTFNNGMSEKEVDRAQDLQIAISNLIMEVEGELPRHRNYSLVVTKLEEAKLWLRDRHNKPA